jgi:hypothetical protein
LAGLLQRYPTQALPVSLAAAAGLGIVPLRPGYRPQTLEFRAERLQGSFSD